ncbi:hypothetical protein GCM10008949_04390 [Deinococcus humi]|nr:hypothetical protein GCM10008949_04390 [Deinococcus humi]
MRLNGSAYVTRRSYRKAFETVFGWRWQVWPSLGVSERRVTHTPISPRFIGGLLWPSRSCIPGMAGGWPL